MMVNLRTVDGWAIAASDASIALSRKATGAKGGRGVGRAMRRLERGGTWWSQGEFVRWKKKGQVCGTAPGHC